MKLSVGTPAESFLAIMDTGSDLIWTQCKPCKQCFDQETPIFDPAKSSSFSKLSCSDKLCEALSISTCSDGCEYLYSYGDYSSTQGVMGTETFTFGEVFLYLISTYTSFLNIDYNLIPNAKKSLKLLIFIFWKLKAKITERRVIDKVRLSLSCT